VALAVLVFLAEDPRYSSSRRSVRIFTNDVDPRPNSTRGAVLVAAIGAVLLAIVAGALLDRPLTQIRRRSTSSGGAAAEPPTGHGEIGGRRMARAFARMASECLKNGVAETESRASTAVLRARSTSPDRLPQGIVIGQSPRAAEAILFIDPAEMIVLYKGAALLHLATLIGPARKCRAVRQVVPVWGCGGGEGGGPATRNFDCR